MTGEAHDPLSGRTLDGRYELVRRLGQGAMGSVYLARQLWLDRLVAVKVLGPDLPVDARGRRRLHREARVIGRISHPNVVQVYDYGQTASGAPYLVMEYVRGEDPGQVLSQAGLPALLAAAEGILAGLGAAHERGILHRDVKPANMVLRGGDPAGIVLLDFGIAAVLGGDDPRVSMAAGHVLRDEKLTQEGTVIGTPLYMSPEQARGLPVTEKSDIYSVGVILFEWLAGRPPFRGKVRDVMEAHVFDLPPPLVARSGLELPGALVGVVERALAKDPAARFDSAADMWDAITSALARESVIAPARAGPGAPPEPTEWTTRPVQMVAASVAPASGKVPAEPPFVGREAELEKLVGLLDLAADGNGSIVLVDGPEGIGRSRLVQQALDARRSGRIRLGRACASPMSGAPLALVRAAVEDLLRSRSLSPQGLQDRLTDLVAGDREGLSPPERARLAAWLRGGTAADGAVPRETPPEWQDQALLERALRIMSSGAPVVLWMDDLHWCDPATAAFLARLAITLALDPFPLVAVATRTPSSRPAPDDALVRHDGRSVHRLPLGPMPLAEIEQILMGLLPLEASTATRLASRASGSPLHAVQLVRHLVVQGLLRRDGERWVLPAEPGPGDLLPRSLEQMLSERFDGAVSRSGDAGLTRSVLGAAAVLGSAFDIGLLQRVLVASGVRIEPAVLDGMLDELIGAGLFDEPAGPDDRLRWDHPMLRDLALARMGRSRSHRRVCRVAASELLGSDPEGAARPAVEMLLVAGDREAAVAHAVAAGEQALLAGELAEAVRFFELARTGPARAPRLRALWGLGRTHDHLGHTDLAEACYQAILDETSGPLEQGRAWFGLGRCRYNRGDHRKALDALGHALAVFGDMPGGEAAVARSRVLRTLAAVAAELPDAAVPQPDVPGLLAAAGTPGERCEHLATAGYLALRRGDLADAIRWFEEAMGQAGRSGGDPLLPSILCDLGRACRADGDERAAGRYLEDGLALARRNGQHRVEADLQNELGELARTRGDLAEAAHRYRSAVVVWRLLGSRHLLLGSLNLALVAIQAGRPADALAVLDALDAGGASASYRAALLLTRSLAQAGVGQDDLAVAAMEEGAALQSRLAPPHQEAVDVLERLAVTWRASRPVLADRALDLARLLRG